MTDAGYGQIWVGDYWPEYASMAHAHRVALKLTGSAPPVGVDVHHTCQNKLCVNPAHLIVIERGDHMALHKPGGIVSENRSQWLTGRCVRGHELTSENVSLDRRGNRRCLTCNREGSRERMRRRRAILKM